MSASGVVRKFPEIFTEEKLSYFFRRKMKKIAVSVTRVSTLSTKEIYWALGKYGDWGNTAKEKF